MELKPTVNKACYPCQRRKIRCDVPTAGLACQRCIKKGQASSCIRYSRRPRARRADISSHLVAQLPEARHAIGDVHANASSTEPENINHLRPSSSCFRIAQEPTDQVPDRGANKLPTAPPTASPTASPPNLATELTVQEGETRIKICNEIAIGRKLPPPEKMLDSFSPGKELVEYHNGLHFVTILGELLAHNKTRRLTRIVIDDGISPVSQRAIERHPGHYFEPEIPGLEQSELQFLREKQAFSLPPEPYCYEMFKCYFDFCYPHCPVIDRVEFLQSYQSRRYSPFLMQAILLSASQYATKQLLADCGFPNRLAAQKAFCSRATLLYDMGCERSQLRILQGSLLLGSCVFSYTMDKDFRYWLQNAARIAIRMGLHERDMAEDMDPAVYKLCKRIWWFIYVFDIFASITGWRNMRMIDRNECDVDDLTEDDWNEGEIPHDLSHILSPITKQDRAYFIENTKLAIIGDTCLVDLKSQSGPKPGLVGEGPDWPFDSWRRSLPGILRIKQHPQIATDNILPLSTMAMSYRVECILYRAMRKRYQGTDDYRCCWAKQRLQVALLELDTLIGRGMMYELQESITLHFINCASTSLALRIESAVNPMESETSKSLAHIYIRQSISFFRQMRDLPTIRETISLFEWVLKQKGLASVLSGLPGSAPSPKLEVREVVGQSSEGKSACDFHLEAPVVMLPGVGRDQDLWFDDLLGFDFADELGLPNEWAV